MPEQLVLLPGMNCSERLWVGVTTRLTARTGVAVLPGRLNQNSVEGCVSRLLRVLPDRFALAGMSLGGIVAMALLRQAPHRVSRLCLMSTNPYAPTAAQLTGWEAQRKALADGQTARDLQRGMLPALLHRPNRTPELDEQVLAMADETGEKLLDRQLAAQATRLDERRWLPAVGVPTLILAAENDALCPVERHREMLRLIPGSRLVMLENVGHLSTMEAPGRIAKALGDWLVV